MNESTNHQESVTDAPQICQRCRGTGVVSAKDVEMPNELGTFCQDCTTGQQRWNRTKELVQASEVLEPSLNRKRIL
jgi:hypothetical protein